MEKYNEEIEEIINETNPSRNSEYLMDSTDDGQRNNDRNNESYKNIKGCDENVNVFEKNQNNKEIMDTDYLIPNRKKIIEN